MYEEFYGFSEAPFNPGPDPRFLYMAPSHAEAYSAMRSGIMEKKGITAITGEPGTGKTTLIRALLSDLDEKTRTAFVFFTGFSYKDLLKNILSDLEIQAKGEQTPALLEKFNAFLAERPRDETVAIIIDEAQALDTSVLKEFLMLWDGQDPASNPFQVILVGQPELKAKLGSKGMKDLTRKIAVRREIRPLTIKESKAYIDHRLRKVGSTSASVLRPDVVDRICEFARGIPRIINMVCDSALLIGYSQSKKTVDEKTVSEAVHDLSLFEPAVVEEGRPPAPAVAEPALSRETAPVTPIPQPVSVASQPSRAPRRAGEHPRSKPWYAIIAVSCAVVVAIGLFAFFSRDNGPSKETQSAPIAAEPARTVPVPKTAAAPKPMAVVVAEKGSALFVIAKQRYGVANPTVIDLILQANPEITDVNLIRVNQEIKTPAISDESFLIASAGNTYRLHLGTFIKMPPTRYLEREPVLRGKTVEVVPHPVSSRQTWYRIVAGQFGTKDDALKVIQTLKSKGLVAAPGGSREQTSPLTPGE